MTAQFEVVEMRRSGRQLCLLPDGRRLTLPVEVPERVQRIRSVVLGEAAVRRPFLIDHEPHIRPDRVLDFRAQMLRKLLGVSIDDYQVGGFGGDGSGSRVVAVPGGEDDEGEQGAVQNAHCAEQESCDLCGQVQPLQGFVVGIVVLTEMTLLVNESKSHDRRDRGGEDAD